MTTARSLLAGLAGAVLMGPLAAVAAPDSSAATAAEAPIALAPAAPDGDVPTTPADAGTGLHRPAPLAPYAAKVLDALETTAPPEAWNGGEPMAADVRAFYAARAYQPIWTDAAGPLPRATTLVDAVLAASADGLEPSDYLTVDAIEMFETPDPARLAELEATLTWAYVGLASDLKSGRTVPNKVDPELFVHPHELDAGKALAQALAVEDVGPVVASHAPQTDGYAKLKQALAQYREIRRLGGWTQMSGGEILRPGHVGPRVLELRQILAERGEAVLTEGDRYDDELEAAVKTFQTRHGLTPDGAFGPISLRALNTTTDERIAQLKLNMERQRWMPAYLGARYAFVNLADYKLQIVFHEEVVYETRVVVGTEADRTPVFSDKMTYLVINPYWTIPPSIAKEEMLPQLRDDPYSLLFKGIRVYSGWGANAEELDPGQIDWHKVSPRRFPYKLRQDPGDGNALGRVKFMFPNKFDIYLHDTPSKSLFNRTVRAFSHGCIRVENPFDLAKLLLSEDKRWTPERFDKQIESMERRAVGLPHPINVHLTYLTAWVDDLAVVQFRTDVYRRDRKLAVALDASRESRVAALPDAAPINN